MQGSVKLVRYQMNPQANWGPQSKAVAGKAPKGAKQKQVQVVAAASAEAPELPPNTVEDVPMLIEEKQS